MLRLFSRVLSTLIRSAQIFDCKGNFHGIDVYILEMKRSSFARVIYRDFIFTLWSWRDLRCKGKFQGFHVYILEMKRSSFARVIFPEFMFTFWSWRDLRLQVSFAKFLSLSYYISIRLSISRRKNGQGITRKVATLECSVTCLCFRRFCQTWIYIGESWYAAIYQKT